MYCFSVYPCILQAYINEKQVSIYIGYELSAYQIISIFSQPSIVSSYYLLLCSCSSIQLNVVMEYICYHRSIVSAEFKTYHADCKLTAYIVPSYAVLPVMVLFSKKETFFETKPRLVRRNTLLLREGVDCNSTGFTEFGEIQSVSVIGKGYSDDVPSGQTTSQLSKAGRDKRRLVKGLVVHCLLYDVFVFFSISIECIEQ